MHDFEPGVDHSVAFKRRRTLNWVALGATYAFLYFGRYNLAAIADLLERDGLLSKSRFGEIDAIGAFVYGAAFFVNGPLTDRFGGRVSIGIAALGSAVMNTLTAMLHRDADALLWLNAANMYFQSFGAVAIVKINAPWFHVRERGVFGGLFGILVSLGFYFSYDWSLALANAFGFVAVFAVPAAVLLVCVLVNVFVIRDRPSTAGHADFDTGDVASTRSLRSILSQRVIWIVVAIELCSGFLRQGAMKWFRLYARAAGQAGSFVYLNWGLLLCVSGIIGAVSAGFLSDRLFQSRRGPVAALFYGVLVACVTAMFALLGSPALGWSVMLIGLCIVGVHAMLSAAAPMDFGGAKSAGVVTGIIDGAVYMGAGLQALLFGTILPRDASESWIAWPTGLLPVAIIGLLLCTRVWSARPRA